MRQKNVPVFFALFLLFVVALQWLWQPGDAPSLTESSQAEPSRQEPPLPGGLEVEPGQDAVTPVTASSAAWSPPAVFGQVGTPSPKIPYPRGEHASRRYRDVASREIDPQLLRQGPAVLAHSPRDGRLELNPEERDAHTKTAVRLVFDPAAIDQVVEGQTAKVLVPTPGEEVLTLEFETIRTRSKNTHTLQGHVAGETENSVAQIVYHDGILHGSVMRYETGQEIEYRIMEDGHMMVRELDPESLADAECGTCASGKEGAAHAHSGSDSDIQADIEDQIYADLATEPATQSGEEQEPVSRDTSGWRTIDVAVGYSAQARSNEGGASQIEAKIIASVDRMTLAFANSDITDTEIVLVGTIEDPDYAEPGTGSDLGDELIDLRNDDENNPALNIVTDYATQLGADLISFLTVSSQGGQSGVANSGNRYTINSVASMTAGQMVFAHELGHNLGCAHAWGDSSEGNTSANMGWRFQGTSGTKYTTIMAYGAGWNNSRIPYYSNPNVLHPDGDVPTGSVPGYDATNDPTVDPQLKPGYDGSVATRGANNANTINTGEGHSDYGATVAAAWDTRTAFSVVSPGGGDQLEPGYTYTIFFGGSDMDDLADILLYKGGVLHTTLASGVNAATHASFSWSIPFDFEEGTDYMIRVELDRNGSTLTADSGIFSILNNLPNVIAQDPVDGIAPRSQLSVSFNLPMDTATFSTGTDIVSFTDPDGTDITGAISGTSWSAQDTVLTVDFSAQSKAGTYQLVLGPDIRDTFGNQMDQDGDGTAGESIEDRYTMNFTLAQVPAYYADMDTDPGWTFDHPSWEYGQPTGGNQDGRGAPGPSAGVNGPNIIAYRLDGDFEASIPETRWVTTPAIDCTNYTNLTLSFQRWLGVDKSFDRAYIQASTNGVTWIPVWENDTTVYLNESTWGLVEYDISAIADGQPTVYLRWGMGKTDSSWNMCGWNIDEVLVDGDLVDGVVLFTATGGESYFADTAVNLSWGSSLGGDVQIELLKNGSVDSVISASTPNDNSYTWQIPAGQAPASDYQIRITSLADPSRTATSPANFTITAPPSSVGLSYAESFESGLGDWTQEAADDFDWIRQTGGTPSSDTGPSSAQDGSYYLYTEASYDNNPNKLAQISTWFDLKGTSLPELSFDYHMLGTSMGTLAVEVSRDGVVWDALFSKSGDQGNAWIPATISLDAYSGQYLKIRISGITGSNLFSDIAIDNLTLTETDTTPPTLASTDIVDDQSGGPALQDTKVTYTVTFSKVMDASTVTAADFANHGTSSITIDSLTEVSGGVFEVVVTPTSDGSLQLKIPSGATLTDPAGNPLDTTADIIDDTSLTVPDPATLTYTVTYEGNGSDGGSVPDDASSPYNYEASVTVLGNTGALTRTGFTFAGWNTASDGSGSGYAASDSFSITIDTVLYAQWTPSTYTVSYDGNGNTSGTAPDDQVKTHGQSLTLASNSGSLAKDAYAFEGWNTANDGSGTDYGEAASFATEGDTTLYAKWNGPPTVDAGPDQTIYLNTSVWSPADIATAAWYDATDATTITESGGVVSQWKDKSGNDHHATQGNAASQPSYNSSDTRMNNLPTIGYDQGFKFLNTPSLAVIRNVYVVTYYDDPDDSFDSHRVLFSDTGNSIKLQGQSGNNDWVADKGFDHYRDGASTSSDLDILPMGPTLWTAQGTASHTNKVWRILAGANNFQYWEYGAVGEIILTDGSEDLATQQRIEGYLAHKWGLAGNLPASHPYKAAAPGVNPTVATLDGTVNDPDGDSVSPQWTKVAGPAVAVNFGDDSATDTTAAFTELGTYTLRLTADDGFHQPYDEVVITVVDEDSGSTFSDWIAGYEVGGQTAPGDDFDGDGIPNAVENYFGTNPGTHNAGLVMTQVADGGAGGTTFAFTHPISDNPATDLTAAYRWSKDLSLFHGSGESDVDGTTVTFAPDTPVDGEVTVTATLSGTDTDRIFFTVEVTQQ